MSLRGRSFPEAISTFIESTENNRVIIFANGELPDKEKARARLQALKCCSSPQTAAHVVLLKLERQRHRRRPFNSLPTDFEV